MSEITQAASIQTATCETMFSRTIVRDQQRSTIWWSQTGSNRRPHACKARALPAELWPRNQKTNAQHSIELVGLGRLELPTSRLSSARSNQLSYKPEPGVSGQKPAIRHKSDYRMLITDSWSARSRRKRKEDGGVPQMDLIDLKRSALMFPRDPIETREAPLKDHP